MILLVLCTYLLDIVSGVGPDLTARDRLVKDLPNGVFAGKKLTPKVILTSYMLHLQINSRNLETNHFSLMSKL